MITNKNEQLSFFRMISLLIFAIVLIGCSSVRNNVVGTENADELSQSPSDVQLITSK